MVIFSVKFFKTPMSIENESNKAVSGLIANVYQDLASPSFRTVGSAIESIFKIGLSPISMLDWGFERSKAWLINKIEERITSIPPECRVSPSSVIAVGTITQISLSHDAPELRDLYAELLLKAMDSRTCSMVHPAYITLLTQLSPQEALIFLSLKQLVDNNEKSRRGSCVFSEVRRGTYSDGSNRIEVQFNSHCQKKGFPDSKLSNIWLDNLKRLSLVEIHISSEGKIDLSDMESPRDAVLKTTEYKDLIMTDFGLAFLEACAPIGAEI